MTAPSRKFSLLEQYEEARRELQMRHRVYPGRVRNGSMKQAEADLQIDCMRAIRDTLKLFAEHEDAIRAVIRAGIERKRLLEDLDAIADDPAVAQVRDAFPGAEITVRETPAEPTLNFDAEEAA